MVFLNLMISSNLFLKKYSVSEIFPTCKGESYILDGTNCNSYGILCIKMESLSFEISQKSRLNFRDGRKNYFNLSWTSEDSLEKYQDLLQVLIFWHHTKFLNSGSHDLALLSLYIF